MARMVTFSCMMVLALLSAPGGLAGAAASVMDGKFLAGPLYPPEIFKQPSQGLYTFPAVLERKGKDPLVCLVDGHYFQAAMTLRAEPLWYKLPKPGQNRTACEGFLASRSEIISQSSHRASRKPLRGL